MRKRLNVWVWLAAMSCAANIAFAQTPSPITRLPAPTPTLDPATGLPIAVKPKWEAPRFDLDFTGGAPRDLLEAMAAQGARPNIVIQPECKNGMIPPIQLRDVTAAQVFSAVNTLREPDYRDGMFRLVPQQDDELWALVKPASQKAGAGLPQYSFPAAQQPGRICKVYNLTPLLEEYTIDDVTTAIQGAWDLLAMEKAPELKFHRDTKLLIIVGANEHLMVVQDVIRELTLNVTAKRGNPSAPVNSEASKPTAPKPVPPPTPAPTPANSKQ